MKMTDAIEAYFVDMRSQGRINSAGTERSYRSMLMRLAEDVGNRDPRTIGREDVKRCLRRWPKPNSQRVARAIFVSFFDWAMEEGVRKDNPARQTRRPKRQPTNVYRLTDSEASAMLHAASGVRERRAIYLGLCAGLRNAELRGLRGEHFQREGFIWVSPAVAKGSRERWIPVLPDLLPIVAEIRAHVAVDEYVLPAQRWRDAPWNTVRMDLAKHASSSQALRSLVMRVAKRAGIAAHVHPHLMRHYFGQRFADHADIRSTQFLLGHADIGTTQIYTGRPSLDALARTVALLPGLLPPLGTPQIADHATTGSKPVQPATRGLEPIVATWLESQADKIQLYREHFSAL